MLVGNILSVQWPEVWTTGAMYLLIGAFHFVFRKRFLEISINRRAAASLGTPVRFWDFLFYASFGFVVTRSVAIAGVLLVFSYLIVPTLAANLLGGSVPRRLAIGWSFATLVSVVAMVASAIFDLPTGATVVCAFGLILLVLALTTRMTSGAAPA